MSKIIVITGASSGIGKCTAQMFRAKGETVVNVSREIDADYPDLSYVCDVSNEELEKNTIGIVRTPAQLHQALTPLADDLKKIEKKKAADELRQKLISSGQSFTEDDINASLPNYTEPPEDEVWVCCNGEYIRVRNGKLEYIMEDDPYIGCGVMPGKCNCNNCISPGTNYGPSRL